MSLRSDLVPIVEAALVTLGGSARIKDIAKYIWLNHEPRLRAAGDDFYVWQYEMRWAGQALVKAGRMTKTAPVGVWRLLP
ncbi:hypothetical protein [Cereibacter sphaeroides]|uniref:hypothetical protein n=1 Tax=Cereibacter sphaeroides TaxID=1063 RepID=UPI0009E2F100|nr:hypothetical protein [Cereibacter sphaeroides]